MTVTVRLHSVMATLATFSFKTFEKNEISQNKVYFNKKHPREMSFIVVTWVHAMTN